MIAKGITEISNGASSFVYPNQKNLPQSTLASRALNDTQTTAPISTSAPPAPTEFDFKPSAAA